MKTTRILLAATLLAVPAIALAEDFREKRVTCRYDRNHMNPRWSLDRSPKCDTRGDRLCFEVRELGTDGRPILRLYTTTKIGKDSTPGCPLGFTEPEPISDPRTLTMRAQWSPVSGDTLVAQKRILGWWQIVKIVVGGGEQVLTSGDFHHQNPQWSQDGKYVVFERKVRGEPASLGVVCANGCNEIVVGTPSDGSHRNFASFHWSTLGRLSEEHYRIVYEVANGSVTDIASFEFDDLAGGSVAGTETRVTQDGEIDRFPQFIDGFYLWQRLDFEVARWQIADRPASLAQPPRILTAAFESGDAEADHISPRVAPNNPFKIIYVKLERPNEAGEGGGPVIYRLLRPDSTIGGRPIEKRVTGPEADNPQWAPNGDNIVFQKKVENRWQVFILDTVL